MNFINVLTKFVLQVLNSKEKEVSKMKKCTLVMLIIVAAALCFAVTAKAATDNTVSVTASAAITGSTTLTADATAFAYGNPTATPPVPPSGDVFPTTPASKRVVLTSASNYNPWKIDIYTNNTQIPLQAEANGMYAKGGLVAGSGPYNVVPLKWVAKNPSSTAPTAASINFQTTYNFVKDKRDEDDPATTTQNESWTQVFTDGYPNVAWGPVSGHSGVCVDPTNTTAGPTQYRGDNIDGSVAIYVAALFATGGVTPAVPASAGTYSGTIWFDLYHP